MFLIEISQPFRNFFSIFYCFGIKSIRLVTVDIDLSEYFISFTDQDNQF